MTSERLLPLPELEKKGRPAFIPKAAFRQWMTTTKLNKLMEIDGITAAGYVGRCARKGRPIKSIGSQYRPLDIVARARAEALEVMPPKPAQKKERIEDLEARIADLEREYRALQEGVAHKIEMSRLSEGLTNRVLLTEQEIVEGAEPQPALTGIYFLVKGKRVVYVGQSVSVLSRIAAHKRDKDFDRFTFVPCERSQMDALESIYIHCLRPELNGRMPGENGWHAPMRLQDLISQSERTVEGLPYEN